MHDLETNTQFASPSQVAIGLIDAWNNHDVEGVMSFYAPHYEGLDVGQATPEHGLEGKRQAALRYFNAYPDLRFTVEQVIEQDNSVAVCWIASGTHQGHLMGIPPTRRTMSVHGTSTLTIEDGKIVRATYVWDVAGMLREIGLLPEL